MQNSDTSYLDRALAYFDEIRPELLEHHRGKFAVIQGRRLLGTFDTAENAYGAGLKGFHSDRFLIKKVEAEDRPFLTTRFLHDFPQPGLR